MAACGLGTGGTHATTTTRAGQSKIRSIAVVRRPAVGPCRDSRRTQQARYGGRLALYFSTVTVFEEKKRTRMSLPSMRVLRAHYEPRAGGGRAAAVFSRPGPKTPRSAPSKSSSFRLHRNRFAIADAFKRAVILSRFALDSALINAPDVDLSPRQQDTTPRGQQVNCQ